LKSTCAEPDPEVLVFEAILKNTMNMNSLRSPAPIILLTLLLSLAAPAYVRADSTEQSSKKAPSTLPMAPAIDSAASESSPIDSKEDQPAKSGEKESGDKTSSKTAKTESDAKDSDESATKPKGIRGFLKLKKKDADAEEAEGATADSDKKAKEKEAPPPIISKEQKEAAEKRIAQMAILKTMTTPFSSPNQSSAPENKSISNTISLSGNDSTLRSRGLGQRFSQNRVFLPPKMIIGRVHEFVVKGRPGSNVAIAMADKDTGAKDIFGHSIRLGPDRKVVGGGVIPESGLLTVYVEMPIQGDLIGLPVFFETAIWQKPDFSDLELANPVKSETVEEIANKPNGILVSEEKAEQKRGIRFVPESGVPLHQRGNGVSLESGRP
jgi:hypothetical protein